MDVRVYVIDDGSVAIRGAIQVLQMSDSCQFAGALTGLDEVDLPGRSVLVADPDLSDDDSLAALSGLPDTTALLVMSAVTRPEFVRKTLQAGARGYIGKDADVATLLAAIAAVDAGGLYLGAGLSNVLISQMGPPEPPATVASGLTRREQDVLTLVANGFTHKQIGTRLGLSKATVDTYVHRIRQKVGYANKAGLTRVAMDLNLLSDAS